MAIDVASFTPAEADQLRRAMGSKRSRAKMERLRERFYTGTAANGIVGELADRVFMQVEAFSDYGFRTRRTRCRSRRSSTSRRG